MQNLGTFRCKNHIFAIQPNILFLHIFSFDVDQVIYPAIHKEGKMSSSIRNQILKIEGEEEEQTSTKKKKKPISPQNGPKFSLYNPKK